MEARRLTKVRVNFPEIGAKGHLWQAYYQDGNIAIAAGGFGIIGKLSINLVNRLNELEENEFFVKLYSEGLLLNDACFETGLFEKVGEPFKNYDSDFDDVKYQKWRLKK